MTAASLLLIPLLLFLGRCPAVDSQNMTEVSLLWNASTEVPLFANASTEVPLFANASTEVPLFANASTEVSLLPNASTEVSLLANASTAQPLETIIRQAEQILNDTVNDAKALNVTGLEQLLPHLLAVPGNNPPIDALTSAVLQSFLRQGNVELQSIGLPDGVLTGSGFRSSDSSNADLLSPSYRNIDRLTGPIARFATGYQPTAGDIAELIKAVPAIVEDNTRFGVDDLSPELIRHLLRGGQVPGVPAKTLEGVVANYLRQMSLAAQQANAGFASPLTEKVLPLVDTLPIEFVQNVANGHRLPGLTVLESRAIREYYVRQLSGTDSLLLPTTTEHAPEEEQLILPPGFLAGIGARELLNRLPPSFDLSRLPTDMLRSITSGEPFNIARLPNDMLASFRAHNPDLMERIDDALSRTTVAPLRLPTPEVTATTDEGTPYDIQDVGRQADIVLEGPDEKKEEDMLMVYTVIGLGSVALISVLVIGFMVCRHFRSAQKAEAHRDAHNDTSHFISGEGVYHQRRSLTKLRSSTSTFPVDAPSMPQPTMPADQHLPGQTVVQRHHHQTTVEFVPAVERETESTVEGELAPPTDRSANNN